ncbi:Opacity protein and related surface antigens [Legionella donaldsonii]|uniref:Opacity protein and related surface antigens n=1 Tax=Legionella donaldsonii TaxID=45060 RepID=A0A378IYY2_9GAMM|nr:outer membrane beta-barrel protein [Legionella donaldsonii]STX40318.1 Opacity protein and related surface antigens [Legionella donaldsonii]
MPAINQRTLCYAFVSLFAISTSCLANNLPWQGPYAGFYLGGGFGNNHISTHAGSVTNTSYFATSADIDAVNNAGTWRKEPNRMIVGLQAGHDWVWKQMIYGAALDYGSFSLSSSNNVNNPYPGNSDQYTVYTSVRTNWLFTLRGRLGYRMLNFPSLLYLTGGMAVAQLKVSNNFNDNSFLLGIGGNESRQNQIGWTAGAGIEVAAFKPVSVNIEYLYIDLPSIKTLSSIYNTQGGFGIPEQSMVSPLFSIATFHASIVKIGLNYRFDE